MRGSWPSKRDWGCVKMDSFARRIIRDHLPAQHRAFYAALPMVFVGHVDSQGDVWASILAGRPGFVHAPMKRPYGSRPRSSRGIP